MSCRSLVQGYDFVVVSAGFRQTVPRPDSVAKGERPPWSRLPLAARQSVSVEVVERIFSGAELEASPPKVVSSVLVPILSERGEATVVLTRRSAQLVRDPTNVSFPGGRLDPGESPLAAALREAYEEIGLVREEIRIVGALHVVERRRDEEIVAPFVGVIDERPTFVANTDEVDAILEIPLATLLGEKVAWEERWGVGEDERAMHFFAHAGTLGSDLVWGLTARILWELCERIADTLVIGPSGEISDR